MSEADAAEARGHAKAARRHEETGRPEEARRLYLEAAAKFLTASKQERDGHAAELRRDLAESFYAKALHMAPPSRKTEPASNETTPAAPIAPIGVPSVTFRDVAGMEEVKKAIRKAIVLPLKRPDLFAKYGRTAGDGILLYGPPGCGKTHLARAAAGECGIPFFNVKTSDVLSRWVGDNERNLKSIFAQARKAAPSIVFFDEIDALARRRSSGESSYVNRLVNELLQEIDGLDSKNQEKPLLIIGATNEPWALDPAFRRPGRFTRLLFVPPPDFEARMELLKLCCRGRPVAADVDMERIAAATGGYSMADVKQICDDAADIPLLEALERDLARPISISDFEQALARRKPSLVAWHREALQRLQRSGEKDAFPEIWSFLGRDEATNPNNSQPFENHG